MKKLVLRTQYQENYGAHDWDGEGECPQYWKFKGGSTYVVYGITPEKEADLDVYGILTFEALIEHDSEYSREYIRSMDFVGESEAVVEEWDYEHVLSFDKEHDAWRCSLERNPYTQFCDYDRVRESWLMAREGARVEGSFSRFYHKDGTWYPESEVLAAKIAKDSGYE